MAWSSPMTATTGNVLTASQFNQYWRDNLLVSEAASATGSGNLLVSSAAHAIVERVPAVDFTGGAESTTSTTFTTFTTSTSVAIETGTKVLLSIGAGVSNNTAAYGCRVGVDTSGDTTLAASDTYSFYADSGNAGDGFQGTYVFIYSVNAGFNLFDLRYRAVFGGTATFNRRLIAAVPF